MEIIAIDRKPAPSFQTKRIARMSLQLFGKLPHYSNEIYSVKLKMKCKK
jgi:hypothetical protein